MEGWPAVSVSHFPTRRAVRATFTPAPGRRLLQETLTKNGKLFLSKKSLCFVWSYPIERETMHFQIEKLI
jgi:hypothetical protein